MTPGAHLLASWLFAETTMSSQRERRLVTLAGIVPDLDGIGVAVDIVTNGRTEYFQTYHHLLSHNLLFGVLISALAIALVKTNRLRAFIAAICTFHLHLLCDLVGSKGPDGDLWPIRYLYPFSEGYEISWKGQWLLNGWQNLAILSILLAVATYLAFRRRRSFVEVISGKLDKHIFIAIQKRWPA